jgi:hypothetical protein
MRMYAAQKAPHKWLDTDNFRNSHTVVTTMRSQSKADKIKAVFSKYDKGLLGFTIAEDIAQPGAFKDAVLSTPPFDAVIHTASPFTFSVQDIQKVETPCRASKPSSSNNCAGPLGSRCLWHN